MNHTQRQLIKGAYQEGYYQALDEGFLSFLKSLRNIFRGDDATRIAKRLSKKMDKEIT